MKFRNTDAVIELDNDIIVFCRAALQLKMNEVVSWLMNFGTFHTKNKNVQFIISTCCSYVVCHLKIHSFLKQDGL